MTKIKVGILCNIVVPYSFPFFRLLSQDNDLDFEVIYMAKTAKNRPWHPSHFEGQMNFPHTYLPGIKMSMRLKAEYAQYVVNPTIVSFLQKKKFDVVIVCGWFDFSCQIVSLMSRFSIVKYIVWSDSTSLEKSWIRAVTKPFVRWFLSGASAYIASGTRAKQYFKELLASDKSIFVAPNIVDNEQFSVSVKKIRRNLSQTKKKYHIPPTDRVILFVGQFIKRKGVDILLEAFRQSILPATTLLLVGYGEEEKEYCSFISNHKMNNVRVVSGVGQEKIMECYAIADLFILPSREETWGLVVNEAFACSLPVIVSDRVGCVDDLVRGKGTGKIFESGNTADLSNTISSLLHDKLTLKFMGKRAKTLIDSFSAMEVVRSYKKAIFYATKI